LPDQLHGVDLLPYLKDERKDKPHENLLWKFTISSAIRLGAYKLISIPDRFPMLYNLVDDISEQKNLVFKEPALAKKMLKKLGEWEVRLPHPVFLEGSVWKYRQLKLYDKKYQLKQPVK